MSAGALASIRRWTDPPALLSPKYTSARGEANMACAARKSKISATRLGGNGPVRVRRFDRATGAEVWNSSAIVRLTFIVIPPAPSTFTLGGALVVGQYGSLETVKVPDELLKIRVPVPAS